MNLSYRVEARKISLKPYIYPRYYDIPESFEKALIQKTKFFNSRLHTSQRQTQIFSRAETFRDIDEFDVDPLKNNKSAKKQSGVTENNGDANGDEDEKTIQSLFSRINRFYSLNGYKGKMPVKQLSERTNNENDQLSMGRRSSHQSQNSYKRLKQLYQLVPHQYDVQALNYSYHHQETLKSSNQKKREMSETYDIHNCSYTRNTGPTQKDQENKSVQTPNVLGLHSATKRQNSLVVQRNTKQFAVSLFTKLQNIKSKKTKRNSLVSCTNYQYF